MTDLVTQLPPIHAAMAIPSRATAATRAEPATARDANAVRWIWRTQPRTVSFSSVPSVRRHVGTRAGLPRIGFRARWPSETSGCTCAAPAAGERGQRPSRCGRRDRLETTKPASAGAGRAFSFHRIAGRPCLLPPKLTGCQTDRQEE